MKLTLAQLKKLKFPYSCNEEINLEEDLKGFENIIDLSTAKIDYKIYERGEETYLLEFNIKVTLKLYDSITLATSDFNLDINYNELYSKDESLDASIIENDTLDTKEAIIEAILINKPMNYSDSEFESQDENEDDGINPAFARLKDMI